LSLYESDSDAAPARALRLRARDVRLLFAAERARERESGGVDASRVRWLRILVRRFGAERVGWDPVDNGGIGSPFEPPPGWDYEEWRARKALRAGRLAGR
jgi:hypothetical protein